MAASEQLPFSSVDGDKKENDFDEKNKSETAGFASLLIKTFVSMAGGFLFGFFFERSHVYEPSNIREQFFFTQFVMLKMFMGAMVGACVSFLLIFNFGGTPKTSSVQLENGETKTFLDHRTGQPSLFDRIRKPKYGIFKESHAVRAAIGGTMLGAGMVVAGACPGMVMPQIGTGVPNAGYTVLGGLVGALLHNEILEKRGVNLKVFGPSITEPEKESMWQTQNRFVDIRFGIPFPVVMVVMVAFISIAVILLEVFIPYQDELLEGNPYNGWPPSLCGFGIGALNLPTALNMQGTMGSSTPYSLMVGKTPKSKRVEGESFLESLHRILGNYHQVLHLLVAVLGAFVSATTVDNLPTSAPGVETPYMAFGGGLLMLFGSRLGNGCTSGHGIAGVPLMDTYGFIAVGCMFASGIVVSFSVGRDNLDIWN